MDLNRFNALARVLSVSDSRRRVLGLLTAVPVVGGLLGLLPPEATDAAGRHKRRKNAHKQGNGRTHPNRKHKKKPPCTPELAAQTCAGTCGSVTNTCKQTVDCGPCAACAATDHGTACVADGDRDGVCADRVCVPCGGATQPCCAGDTCADFGCCDPMNGHCVAGGGVSGQDLDTACAGEHMVCDCGQDLEVREGGTHLMCTRPGVCRVNHAPVATNGSVVHAWESQCVPITTVAYDYNGDYLFLRLRSLPQEGFLTQYVNRAAGPTAEASAPGLNWNTLDNPAGWASGEPSPPIPALADCPLHTCPEGWYQMVSMCWIPFQPTFTGFDAFTYSVVDLHGVESAPATFTIEIFER